MKTILKMGEKIFQKYIWLVSIFYVIGYLLIRIQYAQHGISEVEIFKERYLLASIMFILYCLPILLLDSILEKRRKRKGKNKIDIFLTTILITTGMSYLLSMLPAIIYSDSNYGNIVDAVGLISVIICLGVVMILEVSKEKLKNQEELVNSLWAIAGIVMFVGLSIGSYANFKQKEDWLNMYIASFFIMQTILILRLWMEKFYINKPSNISIKQKCYRVKLGTLLLTLLLYGNFVFKSLPLEIGGGKLTKVEVETEDLFLAKQIQNRNVYLLDRSGDSYILIIEEDEKKDLYKTIEIAKDQAIISITREVTVKYFK